MRTRICDRPGSGIGESQGSEVGGQGKTVAVAVGSGRKQVKRERQKAVAVAGGRKGRGQEPEVRGQAKVQLWRDSDLPGN